MRTVASESESVTAIRHLIRAARDSGLELDEGPTATQPAFSARVTLPRAHQLWERAVHALGPSLPLVVAGASDEHISLLYFASLSCRTIGDAVQLTVAHWRYITDAFPAFLTRRDGALHLRLSITGEQTLGARLGIEYLLAAVVRTGRELTDGAWRPSALVLPHRPPNGLPAWEAACGVPVRVDPAAPGLVMAEDTLATPVRSRLSRAAGQLFVELLDWYTPEACAASTVAARVAEALGRDLGAAAPTVEQVASELALSARSLHRQLAAEGTSYQRVLDRLRCDEAIRQTLDPRRPLKAVAAAVGFADPRAFRRAFKRWTGTTPQQFRLHRLGATLPPGERLIAR